MDKTFLQLNKIVLFEQFYPEIPRFNSNYHESSHAPQNNRRRFVTYFRVIAPFPDRFVNSPQNVYNVLYKLFENADRIVTREACVRDWMRFRR